MTTQKHQIPQNISTRPIPGFPKYRVSNDGQVFNLRGMRLKCYNCNGYRRIGLMKPNGKRSGVDIHRLVAEAWIAPIPKGMWVNHENGIKHDNRVENLRIDTPSYNLRHATRVLGHKLGGVNIKPDFREAVLALEALGWSQAKIARAFGVSGPRISMLLSELRESLQFTSEDGTIEFTSEVQ